MVGLNAAQTKFRSENFAVTFCFAFAPPAAKSASKVARASCLSSQSGRCVGKSREKFDKRKEIWWKKVFSSFSTHTQAKRGFDSILPVGVCCTGSSFDCMCARKELICRLSLTKPKQLLAKPLPAVANRLPNSTRRYQKELPKKIKQRGRDAHLIHEELVQCMKWKQSVSRPEPPGQSVNSSICVLLAWQVLPAAVISDQSEHTARSGDGNKEGIP